MKKLFALIPLLYLILSGCPAPDNIRQPDPYSGLVKNGSFTNGLTDWMPWAGNDAIANIKADNGVCIVYDIRGLKDPAIYYNARWNVLLDQRHINLQKGHVYQVSVDAWADAPREINISTQEYGRDVNGDRNNWTTYGGGEFFAVGTTRQTLSFIYYHDNPDDSDAELQFSFGSSTVTTYLDNAKIIDITDSYVVPEVGANLVINGDFSRGFHKWDYYHDSNTDALPAVTTSGELRYFITDSKEGVLQLNQGGIVLLNGYEYEVKVSAYAEANRPCSIYLDGNDASYQCQLTTTKTAYRFTFTQTAATNYNAKIGLSFWPDINATDANINNMDVFFDDISVKRLLPGP